MSFHRKCFHTGGGGEGRDGDRAWGVHFRQGWLFIWLKHTNADQGLGESHSGDPVFNPLSCQRPFLHPWGETETILRFLYLFILKQPTPTNLGTDKKIYLYIYSALSLHDLSTFPWFMSQQQQHMCNSISTRAAPWQLRKGYIQQFWSPPFRATCFTGINTHF